MRTANVAALTVCVLIALVPAAHAFRPSDRITKNGLGDVEVGMTIGEVEDELGRSVDVQYLNDESCGGATLGSKVFGMFSRGLLTRIDIRTSRYRTRKGVHVKHDAARVPRAHYLRVTMRQRRIVFETRASGVIQMISVGRIPDVDYVEGCA